MASYDLNSLQTQLQNLSRQYQQLAGNQPQVQPFSQMWPVYQTPQIQVPVQPVTPPRQVQYVEGMPGAKLYQDNLPSNSSEVIMDKDENIFYLVSKDANGTPSKHITRCRFEVEDYKEEEPMFLTRKDFDDFKEEIRQMFSSSQSAQKQVTLSSNAPKQVAQKPKE